MFLDQITEVLAGGGGTSVMKQLPLGSHLYRFHYTEEICAV